MQVSEAKEPVIKKVPIVGFIRYSCRLNFGRSNFNYDDLFDTRYLDYRLNIFRNVTLKSFQEQSNKNFVIFLLHSESLPQKYKDIFKEMEQNNHFLRNIYISDCETKGTGYADAFEGSMKYVDFVNGVSISFRIDNDDAVPADFICRLNAFLKPEYQGFAISYPNMLIVQRVGINKYLKQEKWYVSNSIGLAYVTNAANYKVVLTLGDHGKINQKYSMLYLPEKGGLQTINGKNVANSLDLGHVSSFDDVSLRAAMLKDGYADFDFTCLNIQRRIVVLDVVKKVINFIKKRRWR